MWVLSCQWPLSADALKANAAAYAGRRAGLLQLGATPEMESLQSREEEHERHAQ